VTTLLPAITRFSATGVVESAHNFQTFETLDDQDKCVRLVQYCQKYVFKFIDEAFRKRRSVLHNLINVLHRASYYFVYIRF
jgi:hypothetical protein